MLFPLHIKSICKKNGFKLTQLKKDSLFGAVADLVKKEVFTPKIVCSASYAVALHELGHLFTWKDKKTRIDNELAAWDWAADNAIIWDDNMAKIRRECLRSYLESGKYKAPKKKSAIYNLF